MPIIRGVAQMELKPIKLLILPRSAHLQHTF
jgi:hypothetical protein